MLQSCTNVFASPQTYWLKTRIFQLNWLIFLWKKKTYRSNWYRKKSMELMPVWMVFSASDLNWGMESGIVISLNFGFWHTGWRARDKHTIYRWSQHIFVLKSKMSLNAVAPRMRWFNENNSNRKPQRHLIDWMELILEQKCWIFQINFRTQNKREFDLNA